MLVDDRDRGRQIADIRVQTAAGQGILGEIAGVLGGVDREGRHFHHFLRARGGRGRNHGRRAWLGGGGGRGGRGLGHLLCPQGRDSQQ